jgi:hypothetical protein
MIFLFFSLIFVVYILSFFVALFFELPFRVMLKVVVCPPKKILRLKKDLAKQLQSDDPLFGDDMEDDDENEDETG